MERKSSRTDLVSDADRDAEVLIDELLRAERPDDGLLGEEGAHSRSDSGRRWVIDPLDGTTNFLYGLPAWAVSVALEDSEGGAVGVVFAPVADELFTGVRGAGARMNGEPVEVSGCGRIETALVATGFSYAAERRARQAETMVRVLPRVRDVRRAGAAALDLCSVACGRVDGYFERGLEPWDWAAGRLIAAEAGAAVRELPGEPAGLVAASPGIAEGLAGLVG